MYYFLPQALLYAHNESMAGGTARQAMAPEVNEPRAEVVPLKGAIVEATAENGLLKERMVRPISKSFHGLGCELKNVSGVLVKRPTPR